jgi:multidrug efflux pump subunit AcrA (membrane-fusion protein)
VDIKVDEGSPVARGQVLILQDTVKAELAVRQAEAMLAQAKANFARASADLERKQMLLDDKRSAEPVRLLFKAAAWRSRRRDGADTALALARRQLADPRRSRPTPA